MLVRLRKWRLDDAADLARAVSDPMVLGNLRDGLPYPYTEEDGREFISSMLAAEEGTTFAFAVTVDGKVVGSIGAFRQGNIHSRTAEMGYYLAREYWGQGVMTQAVRLLCEHLFSQTDLLRVYAEPFADNIASRRVLEKAGFSCEGILRQNAVKNGRVVDMAMYSRLREEG